MRQLLTNWKNKHTIVSLFCDENDADLRNLQLLCEAGSMISGQNNQKCLFVLCNINKNEKVQKAALLLGVV